MNFQSENKIYCVSSPSGSGKTTIMRSVMSNELVSFTTRSRREGEMEGVDYIFITEQEFEKLLNTGGLIEHTNYGGNFYGLLKSELESKLLNGNVFFVCDYNGYKQIKKICKNVVSIFIYSTKEDCENNMLNRNDADINIQKRLSTYEDEISNLVIYDHVINNKRGFLNEAIQDVKDIIYDI